jgi:hypothetical protein
MDANLDNIATELYGKIQTRFPSIKLSDEEDNVLSKKEDIPRARFFEFEYSEGGRPMGTITMTLDQKDGLVINVSGDLTDDRTQSTHHNAYEWIKSFRSFAKDRLLKFDATNMGKSNLDKRDYQFLAKRGDGNMMESKLFGTARVSYQDLGEARLIIKHNQPVNTELAAGRTMHIECIYIENAAGERFKYPTKSINGARALAEHIKHGGIPYDGIGKHIISLSEELASLRKFKNYVGRQDQLSEAMGDITSKVMERIEVVKKEIHQLQRPAYYQEFAEAFEEQEARIIPEDVMTDWVDRLTIRTFNEELKSVFPYIYKLVDSIELPVKELSADELLSDAYNPNSVSAQHRRELEAHRRKTAEKKAEAGDENAKKWLERDDERKANMRAEYDRRMERESIMPEEFELEEFFDQVVSEEENEPNRLFSDDEPTQQKAVEDLNAIFKNGELDNGGDGLNAIQTLKGIIDDEELASQLKNIDSDLDVTAVIQAFLTQYDQENGTDIAEKVDFNGDGDEPGAMAGATPPAAPTAPEAPAAPTAPEAPAAAAPAGEEEMAAAVAEGEDNSPPWDTDDNDAPKFKKPTGNPRDRVQALRNRGMQAAIARAKDAGAKLDTKFTVGGRQMTLHDAIEECGMTPMECGFANNGSDLKAMKQFMSGFFNREEHNITIGGERLKIKLEKEFPDADPQDLEAAFEFIDRVDPPADLKQHNDIVRLSGIKNTPVDEEMPGANMDIDAMFNQLTGMPGAKVTNTSSGNINGKPASHNDAMSQANNMKFKLPKFGDDDTEGDEVLDFSNPDKIGQTIQKKMGGMMQGVQKQMPNQNVQFPGGQMNPADMMKGIMSKINFGK